MAPNQNMSEEGESIKTMKLYTHVERIKNELASRDLLKSGTIDPIALSEIDSMHYMGNDAIEDAVKTMHLDSSSKVLDIGSGFGGPSRVLSATSKCSTTALELQPDIHEMAKYLTKMCRLDSTVKHDVGDILSLDLEKLGSGISTYDSIVSFLVFLHITDKVSLLGNCAKMLKPGGIIFIEDYYCSSPFSEEEVKSLQNDLYSVGLPTKKEYISHLEASGFHNIQFIDKSIEWTTYVTERVEKFIGNREKFEEVHGEPTYLSLLHFYKAVKRLFTAQNLGGVRIIAEKC